MLPSVTVHPVPPPSFTHRERLQLILETLLRCPIAIQFPLAQVWKGCQSDSVSEDS